MTTTQTPVGELDLAAAALEVAQAVERMRDRKVQHVRCLISGCWEPSNGLGKGCEGRGWVPIEDLATLIATSKDENGIEPVWSFGPVWTQGTLWWRARVDDEPELGGNAPDPTLAAFRAAVAALRARA